MECQALVLAPTRELAQQIEKVSVCVCQVGFKAAERRSLPLGCGGSQEPRATARAPARLRRRRFRRRACLQAPSAAPPASPLPGPCPAWPWPLPGIVKSFIHFLLPRR